LASARRSLPGRSITFELGSTVAVCVTIAVAAATGIWQIATWKSSNDLTLAEIQTSLRSHQDEMKSLWSKKEGDHGLIFGRLTKLEGDMEHALERIVRLENGAQRSNQQQDNRVDQKDGRGK
jgi:hypothetical protein